MLSLIGNLLRGIVGSPWVVGLARGIAEAAVLAGLAVLAGALVSEDVPAALLPLGPALLAGIRTLEGIADNIDPAKKRSV